MCYGRTDVELSPASLRGLDELATRLQDQLPRDVAVFSSPLRRCRVLAERLHGSPLVDARLAELDFGAWEMRPWSLVPRGELDAWAADPLGYAIPGGESVGRMRERVRAFLDEQYAGGRERLALVTHAGVIKVVLGLARDIVADQWMAWRVEHGSLHALDWLPHASTANAGPRS